jgi:hypothetical protein
MWTPTFHRFDSQAAFLAACDAAGWPRDHQDRPVVPLSAALDIIGPLDGDARLHVNALWQDGMDGAWAASEITPASPSRVFAGHEAG